MNEEQGNALAKDLGPSARFFACDVTDTDNIAAVVRAAVDWAAQTGKPLGGIIPAAGVGLPGLVRRSPDPGPGAAPTLTAEPLT